MQFTVQAPKVQRFHESHVVFKSADLVKYVGLEKQLEESTSRFREDEEIFQYHSQLDGVRIDMKDARFDYLFT